MGLFSARGRLPQAGGHDWSVGRTLRAAIRTAGRQLGARLGDARRTAIAATNDARVVAVLLLLAAFALALEMAASFHVI